MKTIYKVNVRTVRNEEGTPIARYGIDAVSEDGVVQNSIIDAFDTCDKADELSKVCTVLELAPEHLQDVVEDIL